MVSAIPTLLCCAFLALLLCLVQAEDPVVATQYGSIAGVNKRYNTKLTYDAFYGIPFAAPPVGDRRWQKPVPPTAWGGTLEAKEFRPYCPQLVAPFYRFVGVNGRGDEDCLYLNIYRPGPPKQAEEGQQESEPLPVMFWVFGGAYLTGASDLYPGEELSVLGNVIVVTINYRVGAVGFVSTTDSAAPGNYGLWDQAAALDWVAENIDKFGGDPKRITVFGQSAGGASVSHLSLSPYTRKKFRRMIAISGSAAAYFAYTNGAEKTANDLGSAVLCARLSKQAMIECMRGRGTTTLDLVGIATSLILGRRAPNLVPVVDSDYVYLEPRRAMDQGYNKELDILVGNCEMDGAFMTYLNPIGLPLGNLLNMVKTKEKTQKTLKLLFSPYAQADRLIAALLEVYPELDSDDLEERSAAFTRVGTDFFFSSPAHLEAETHSEVSADKWGRTYMYEYAYRHSFMKYQPNVTASHVDDLYSVFGKPFLERYRRLFLRGTFTQTDTKVSRNVIGYYANFAYSGDPNVGPHEVPAKWPQYNKQDKLYMRIDAESEVLRESEEKLDKMNYWLDTFYKMAQYKEEVKGYSASNDTVDEDFQEQVEQMTLDMLEVLRDTNLLASDENIMTSEEFTAMWVQVWTRIMEIIEHFLES